MGRIKQGILGGFSGKVGTVIGASWKGGSYMRARPLHTRNPRTAGQVAQRTRFALTMTLLRPLTALLRVGWALRAVGQTPFNAAMAYTVRNVVAGSYPDWEIDPAKFKISVGALAPAANPAAVAEATTLTFTWDDNSGTGSAKHTDRILVAAVNLDRRQAAYDLEAGTRQDATCQLFCPADWAGETVDAYIGFISEDGREIADSCHVGAIDL
jgi:hypothetical protein